jgi:hypothetical protein
MDHMLRLAALSVEPADLERLRHLVEEARKRLRPTLRWAEPAEADVLFIDVDTIYGHMDWLKAQAGGRQIVSICARGGHEPVLQRPLTLDGLVNALSVWADAMPTAAAPAPVAPRMNAAAAEPVRRPAAPAVEAPRPVAPRPAAPPVRVSPVPAPEPVAVAMTLPVAAPAPAVVPLEPAPAPAAAVATELPLSDYCVPETLPVASRVVRGDAPALTIDPHAGVYYGPTGLRALEPYCREPIPRSAWEPISPAVLEGLRAAGGGLPLARLVWLDALVSGNGQLLGGYDAQSRFKLTRWPQTEREYPRHFRIATVMMRGPATLDEIAAQSGVAAGEVADFINASLVSGHGEAETSTPLAAVAEGTGGGLLSRLRQRVVRKA